MLAVRRGHNRFPVRRSLPAILVRIRRGAQLKLRLRIVPRGPFLKVELDVGFFLAAFVTPQSVEDLAQAGGRHE